MMVGCEALDRNGGMQSVERKAVGFPLLWLSVAISGAIDVLLMTKKITGPSVREGLSRRLLPYAAGEMSSAIKRIVD